jgi:predicted neuraminidase
VGNPILFPGAGGRLWLVYVTITVGGWSGSSLNIKWSDDGGITWTESQRLTLSPFLNVSELVRNRPLPMAGGGFAVPIYHECLGDFPEILWLRPAPNEPDIHFKKSRMTGGSSFIQPSIAALEPSLAMAFYRCRSDEKAIGRAVTTDAGLTWSGPQLLSLPNPDSALDTLLLSNQRILMVFNDSPVNRENLRLAVSFDRGRRWTRIATLENAPGGKFSYPYMIRTQDGRIHLVYTWNRKRIRHIIFNEAWIDAQIEEVKK